MPGTIQVSVLEFKGLPSTSPSILLKVALGKKEYQTSNVGNFSFPLTALRDSLVVTVQDAEGNETTLTVIQTMSIVEKVCWNDIFHLDGGGQVHLQFQFILSDEERNRIRSMREAAMKKKQGSIPNAIPGQSEIASSKSDPVISTPQAEEMVSGKRVMNLLGSRNPEARPHQKKKSSSLSGHVEKISPQHGNEHEKKDHNRTHNLRKSRSQGSSGDASGGLIQQAIKVAIVVGFGVLVFLTRQREPRKSNKDTNDLHFEASEYMDEQMLIEEKMDLQ